MRNKSYIFVLKYCHKGVNKNTGIPDVFFEKKIATSLHAYIKMTSNPLYIGIIEVFKPT
jgi:hypothetical protein